jgi:hypothetical protein
MSRHLHQDVFAGLVLVAIAAVLYPLTYGFTGEAATWPRGILLLLAGFGILISMKGVRRAGAEREGQETADEGEEETLTPSLLKTPMALLLVVVVYAALLEVIGFFPSTILFLASYLWYGGVRDWRVLGGVVIGLNVFVYLLFVVQLNVQLPAGLLFE